MLPKYNYDENFSTFSSRSDLCAEQFGVLLDFVFVWEVTTHSCGYAIYMNYVVVPPAWKVTSCLGNYLVKRESNSLKLNHVNRMFLEMEVGSLTGVAQLPGSQV